jgi:alpha-tubulin suppressor-like RCC1 family protein
MNFYRKHSKAILSIGMAYLLYTKSYISNENKNMFCFSDMDETVRKAILKKETDIFIWGKGIADNTSIYTNFHPHRIKKFSSTENNKNIPQNIIDITFNDHLSACIDKNNNLFVWREPKLNSEKSKDTNNHERQNVIRLAEGIKVTSMSFTKDKLFLLDRSGNVYFYNIEIKQADVDEFFASAMPEPEVNIDKHKIIKVKELKMIKMIATGKDHFIALDKDGKLFGMGDDSFGQLGQATFTEQREQQMKMYSNFIERRERLPKQIEIPDKINKVVCGENHTLVLSEGGNVYGFGYNRFLQISNDSLYRQGIIGLSKPTLIPHEKFKSMRVVDIAASKNCSFFVCKDEQDGTYSFFSAGEGLRGQLGQNLIKHMSDVEEMPDISGLVNSTDYKPFEPLKLKCGLSHCLLLFKNPRVLYVWGNNEYGELGTKDRVFYESPVPILEEYSLPFNIINFGVGHTNSAFICEKVDKVKKKHILDEDLRIYREELKQRKKKKRTKNEEKPKEPNSYIKEKAYQLFISLKKYL